jgi:2'-5' RNA ligase
MRVFIAIDLSGAVRSELAAIQEKLKLQTPSARWVAAESIHITLKFIGEVQETRVEDIEHALTGLTWRSFNVAVRGLGFFPGTRSPRVLWAGLHASSLEGLAKEIDTRLERAGFEKEKRAFRAHVTLARAKDTRLEGGLVTAVDEFQDYDFGSFTADRFCLYQSVLKPSGAVYNRLKEYPLSSSQTIERGMA